MKVLILFAVLLIVCSVSGQEVGSRFFKETQLKTGITPINSSASDFGPAFIGNELWFSVFQDGEPGSGKLPYYRLFKTQTDESGKIVSSKEPAGLIIDGKNAGPVSFCEKTGELFVTVNNTEHPDVQNNVFKKRTFNLRIDIAKKTDGKWEITGSLPFNNPSYSVGHPSVSVTGDTLFFVSNKPASGYGGTDIYMAFRVKGQWQEPMNLGENINTEKNEMFPFYLPCGILVYTSDGLAGGFGGLDISYSCISLSGFSKPVNLGEEVNSAYDDFGLAIHPSRKTGYFSSNRPGQEGDDNIYQLEMITRETSGLVADETTGRPVKDASVELLSCEGVKISEIKTGKTGQFVFKTKQNGCYKIRVSKPSFSTLVLNVSGENAIFAKLKKDFDVSQMIAGFLPQDNKKSGSPEVPEENKDKPAGQSQNPLAEGKICFSVQVGASVPYVEKNDPYFKGETVTEVKKIGNFHKYFIGRFGDYSSAKEEAKRLSGKQIKCFVVAFKDGEVIPVAGALKK